MFRFRVIVPSFLGFTLLTSWLYPDSMSGRLGTSLTRLTMAGIATGRIVGVYSLGIYEKMDVEEYRLKHSYGTMGDGMGGTEQEEQQEKSNRHIAAALVVRDLCLRQGGVYIKIGQHLSTLSYLLPDEIVSVLFDLFAACNETSAEDVKRIVEGELGKIEDVFEEFDMKPIASASLAQVHVAKMKDGAKVAVKVLHKRVSESAEIDSRTIEFLVNFLHFIYPKLNFLWISKEVNTNLPKEMNFCNEAANLKRAEALCDDDSIRFPGVKAATRKVLVMDFMEGVKVTDVQSIREMGISTSSVAELVARFFCKQIFVDGFIHCDPHPGNILVRKNSRNQAEIVILDHGLYKEIPDTLRLNYALLWKGIILGDVQAMKEACTYLGIPDSYPLFAAILTTKTWGEIQNNSSLTKLKMKNRRVVTNAFQEEFDWDKDPVVASFAAQYFTEIVDILKTLPRDLLLVLKTNDCLRFIDGKLGSPINQFIFTLRYAHTALVAEKYKAYSGWQQFLLALPDNLPLYFRLFVFELASFFLSISVPYSKKQERVLSYEEIHEREVVALKAL